MTCPLCSSKNNTIFDRRNSVPVHQNGRCTTRQEALATPAGRLEMTGCLECGFAWNAAFDPDLLVYDGSYENDQTYSSQFYEHVADMARRVAARLDGMSSPRIVEVGCGQGTFFEIMADTLGRLPGPASGFDPAWRGADGDGPAGASLFRNFYDVGTAALAGGPPEAIISRHTIEHVSAPMAFLASIRNAAGENPAVRLFIETPCLNWILANGQIQDLFYEHCSLFSAANLADAIKRSGFGNTRVSHVFGGQYLWAESGYPDDKSVALQIPDFDKWQSQKLSYVEHWQRVLNEAARRGPVFLWGGGSKGVTFSLLIDPEGEALAGVVDINPKKQGCFLPLTGIPVISPERLPVSGATIIVMNPVYQSEIESQARSMGSNFSFLSLTDPS